MGRFVLRWEDPWGGPCPSTGTVQLYGMGELKNYIKRTRESRLLDGWVVDG
jgi:hypothetical protein